MSGEEKRRKKRTIKKHRDVFSVRMKTGALGGKKETRGEGQGGGGWNMDWQHEQPPQMKTEYYLIRFSLPFSSHFLLHFLELTIKHLMNSCSPSYEADGGVRGGMQNDSGVQKAATNTTTKGRKQRDAAGDNRRDRIILLMILSQCT